MGFDPNSGVGNGERDREMKSASGGFLTLLLLLLPLFSGCEGRSLLVGRLLGRAAECLEIGASCRARDACCEGVCIDDICVARTPACGAENEACLGPRDCCSSHCVGERCAATCTDDDAACSANEDCCSGFCEADVCKSQNQICRTSGNSCEDDEECCSGLCLAGRCDINSSFCSQSGDICAGDDECCSGTCTLSDQGYLGSCAPAPSGPSFCNAGVAGALCDSCNDCCSRLCVPFGSLGTQVCQQAQGCRQTGELCRNDEECCGGDSAAALPGSGNVSCEKASGEDFGICRNAMSCSPEGNVCHIQDYACSVSAASNKCCAADGSEAECVLDAQGVPRCLGLGTACRAEDEPCAFDLDCCQGRCLPNSAGELRCQDSEQCQSEGDFCTSTADCCPGTLCQRSREEAFGLCSSVSAALCSLSGQACGGEYPDCCGQASCENGACLGVGELP